MSFLKRYFPFVIISLIGGILSCENEQGVLPDIVLIFADDMGYGDVSGLNPEAKTYTPAIDELMNYGICFTEAHANASVCTPSRYGLLTGRYAFRNRLKGGNVNGFGRPVMLSDRRTIAHLLKNAGYTTACIGKWHLGIEWQTIDQDSNPSQNKKTGYSNVDYSKSIQYGPNYFGFDYSFIHPASLDMPPYVFIQNNEVVDKDLILSSDVYPLRLENTEYAFDKKHTGEDDIYWQKGVWWRDGEMSLSFRIEECLGRITKESLKFIERQSSQNPEKPFFLYLPLTGPHTPWIPEDKFKEKSAVDRYGDFILNIDDVVDKIVRKVEETGNPENTMIIFASDNGGYWPEQEIELHDHYSNYGRRGQKGDIWDGGHHVPLIIKWPAKIKEKLIYDGLVSFTDFYATFAELTGKEAEKNVTGDSYSFLHVLYGDTAKNVRNLMVHHSSLKMFAIRKGCWKYIDGLGSGGFSQPRRVRPDEGQPEGQLYNICDDPMESENLFFEYPGIVRELKSELQNIIEEDN